MRRIGLCTLLFFMFSDISHAQSIVFMQAVQRFVTMHDSATAYLQELRDRFGICQTIKFDFQSNTTGAFKHSDGTYTIYFQPTELVRYSDTELHYVIAHETGHILFYDYKYLWSSLSESQMEKEQKKADAFALHVIGFNAYRHVWTGRYYKLSLKDANKRIANVGRLRLQLIGNRKNFCRP